MQVIKLFNFFVGYRWKKAGLIFLAFSCVLFSFSVRAQEIMQREVFTRLSVGPAISFYQHNPRHSSSTSNKAAYNLSLNIEKRLNRQMAFLVGIDYFVHGLNFNSYYFKPGNSQLYSGNFDYRYEVLCNEVILPLLLRLNPLGEVRNHFSPYFNFGYNFRYVLFEHVTVTSNLDGKEEFKDFVKPRFEYPFLYPGGSSFVAMNVGVQKNFLTSHKALYIEAGVRYSLTRMLLKENFSPSSLLIRNHHLLISIGYKI